jgi:rod shape-determining protein MreD
MIVCGITGLFLDVLLTTPLGLHGLSLPLFHILGKQWLRSIANHRLWRPVIFQFITNLIFIIIWYILLLFENQLIMKWYLARFVLDLLLSSIIIIPLSFWLTQFTGLIIQFLAKENLGRL